MHAYKFMPKCYVEGFLERGALRIGTASEFRIPDGLDDGRSDPLELLTEFSPGAVTMRTEDINLPGFREFHGKNVRLRFAEGSTLQTAADLYIYCMSKGLNHLLVARMNEKFGCDACVMIRNVQKFAHEITPACAQFSRCEVIGLEDYTYYGGDVQYLDRNIKEAHLPDPLIKGTRYRWQNEFRLFWGGASPRTGFVVDVPTITPLLKRVDLSRWT